jgi:hypothetical protein
MRAQKQAQEEQQAQTAAGAATASRQQGCQQEAGKGEDENEDEGDSELEIETEQPSTGVPFPPTVRAQAAAKQQQQDGRTGQQDSGGQTGTSASGQAQSVLGNSRLINQGGSQAQRSNPPINGAGVAGVRPPGNLAAPGVAGRTAAAPLAAAKQQHAAKVMQAIGLKPTPRPVPAAPTGVGQAGAQARGTAGTLARGSSKPPGHSGAAQHPALGSSGHGRSAMAAAFGSLLSADAPQGQEAQEATGLTESR